MERWRVRVVAMLLLASCVTGWQGRPATAVIGAGGSAAVVAPEVSERLARGEAVEVVAMLRRGEPSADRAAQRAFADAQQRAALGGLPPSVTVVRRFRTVPALVLRIDDLAGLRALEGKANVVRVDVDNAGGTGSLANTVPIIGANRMQARGITGAGVTVAVLDSGLDRDHPDLAGAAIHEACFGNRFNGTGFCPNGTDRQVGPGAAEDDAGHGTHVTGIVTSNGVVSSVGVAPGAAIVALKVTDGCNFSGCFYGFSEVTAALDYLFDHPELGVDAVNMSVGTGALFTGNCDQQQSYLMAGGAAVDNLVSAGVFVAASAGNNFSTTQMTAPACLTNVVSVGATTTADAVPTFSNTATNTDVLAPGNGVVSDAIGGTTVSASGTSMASPAVAGCAALIHQSLPSATPAAVLAALKATGKPVTRGAATFPRIECAKALVALGPVVATADFDGGGSTDTAVYRPATGQWFVLGGNPASVPFGSPPDDVAVPADYDWDGDADKAVYRPSTGQWFVLGGSPAATTFGAGGDVPVPADYDGDGDADKAVYRPSTGQWFVLGGSPAVVQFGAAGDVPVPGDYDGDGDADVAVYRPSTFQWFILGGNPAVVQFGSTGDVPVPADHDMDGDVDVAVYRPSTGHWFVLNGNPAVVAFGAPGDRPVPGDYDTDGDVDKAVYRPSTGQWFVLGGTPALVQYGAAGDLPLVMPQAIRQAFFP